MIERFVTISAVDWSNCAPCLVRLSEFYLGAPSRCQDTGSMPSAPPLEISVYRALKLNCNTMPRSRRYKLLSNQSHMRMAFEHWL